MRTIKINCDRREVGCIAHTHAHTDHQFKTQQTFQKVNYIGMQTGTHTDRASTFTNISSVTGASAVITDSINILTQRTHHNKHYVHEHKYYNTCPSARHRP